MEWIKHAHLQVALNTLLEREHPTAHGTDAVVRDLMDWETEF